VICDVAIAESPHLRYQTSELVTRLVGVKMKDLTGERVVGLTAKWIR
jgi:hypothetical protein